MSISIKKTLFFLLSFFLFAGCAANEALLNPSGVKILTSKEGIYRVTIEELGWSKLPSKLHFSFQGETHPYWLADEETNPAIYFYAPKPDTIYTTENAFLLIPERGESASPKETYQDSTLPSHNVYTAHLHIEQNVFYEPVAPETAWFGERFIAPQTTAIPFTLNDLAPGAGSLKVKFWGSTKSSATPDHHIQIRVNEKLVADQTWDGKVVKTISANIPKNVLHSGENTLSITALNNNENTVDIVFLDWVEISFPRVAKAQNDVLLFKGENTPLRLNGFQGEAVIFDVTSSSTAKQLTATTEPIFQGEPGHRYLAVGPQGYLSPTEILPLALSPDLKANAQGAEYLILGPSDLLVHMEALITHRQAQGLSSQAVPAEAIYDQFGNGFPDPMAIRKFLQYATQNWDPAPHYVLLLGDATYDPKGYKFSTEGNVLPTVFVDTIYGGETSSDIPLAQLDESEHASEDPWPDLAIGRIPVRTVEQTQVFVEKTIAYEETPPTPPWNKRVFAIADGQEASFKDDAERFLAHFTSPYQTTLFAPSDGDTSAAQEVRNQIEEGGFLVSYFGHGSVKMWGKDKLFTVEVAKTLKNKDRLPIILNFTCLAGFFTHPEIESLSETLLHNPDGGAVAVLAPSSLTLPTNQSALSDALAQELRSQDANRLGDAILQAWRQVPIGSKDVMQTFMLFGDPALQLHHP